jgi:DNA helicase-2/ATP-dependent DNA helicase PcrA
MTVQSIRSLTPEQQAVVNHRSGHLVVEAGPGTGKTETLARRAVSLFEDHDCLPAQIWCASYTRSAAKSLHQRLISINTGCWAVTCGTLHSLALRLVRRHGWRVGVAEDVEVMPASDQLTLITRLAEHHGLPSSLTPRRVLELISLEANTGRSLADLCDTPALRPLLGKLLLIQSDALRFRLDSHLLDYDDILFTALDVMQSFGGHVREYDLRCLLVDEAQDLTVLQLSLIRALADHGVTVTAVGDRMQAIYGWRGAADDVMQRLAQLLPQPLEQLALTVNWRSPDAVVRAAAPLALQSGAVVQQAYRSGGTVQHLFCASDRAEAQMVVSWLNKLNAPLRDCAVIYRSSTHALLLEGVLKTTGIAYSKFGGLHHDDAALKDLAALIRLAVGPHRPSLIRILQTLPGVGKATAVKMANDWPDCTPPAKAENKLLSLKACLKVWEASNVPDQVLPAAASWLGIEPDPALIARAEASSSLRDLLDGMVLEPDADQPETDCLALCTGHYAKGREWPHVCVIGCVHGKFSRPAVAEDSRLLYVALTRAMETLTTIAPLCYRRDDGLFVSGSPLLRG